MTTECGQASGRPTSATEVELAGWWRRGGALFIDNAIVFAAVAGVRAALGVGVFDAHVSTRHALEVIAAATVLALLYFPPLMRRWDGQTLGKRLLGIRVVRASGQPMTVAVAALREVVAKQLLLGLIVLDVFVSAGPSTVVVIVDYLWPIWDQENRALHDYLARTRVVRVSG